MLVRTFIICNFENIIENNFSGKFEIYDSFEEGLSDFVVKITTISLLNDDEKATKKSFSSNENCKKIIKRF